MMRKLLQGLVAVSIVALSVGAAAPASADEADCAESRYVQGGYTAFDIETKYVPPPLRGTDWDCAARIADRPLDDDYATSSNGYILMYVDVTLDEAIELFRRFESMGYADGTEINLIDDFQGTGTAEGSALGADDIAAMDPPPKFVHARFSNEFDGNNIYELTYSDGVEFDSTAGLPGRATFYASILLTEPFLTGTELTDPSVLSSLRSIGEAAPSPTQTAVICGSAVFLMLIVGYPGALLNSVIGSRYEQFRDKLRERRRAKRPADAPVRRAPGWLVWPGFFAAAVIGSFVDPNFGLNWMSARLLVTAFWAFVLLNLAGWTFVRLILRRLQPDANPYIRFRWGSLIVVALAVLIARLLQFEPGIIFGLVAGLAFGITLAASRDAQVILLGSGFALAIALIGWVGYSLLAPVALANPGELWAVFFSEFFSGITVEGISALPLALLPLFALDGAALFKWKKWVWAVGYAVGLAAFMLVLLTIPAAWGEVQGDFLRWTLLYVAFAVVAVAIWGVNAILERRKKTPAPAPAA